MILEPEIKYEISLSYYNIFKRLKILFNIHNCIIVIFTILVKLIIPQVDAYLRSAIIHKVLYSFLQPDGAAILH